jgi:hypothetical protein
MSDHSFPAHFPKLPAIALQHANIVTAHNIISDLYKHALTVLQQENADPLQISYHINSITSDAVPLLSGIEEESTGNNLPLSEDWLHDGARLLGDIVLHLQESKDVASQQ